MADYTEFWERNETDYAGSVKAREIIHLARKYVRGRVLDVGAGTGKLISLIPRAVGIDIAPKSSGIIKASVAKIPFPDNTFQTVFMTDVIEHLQVPVMKDGLREIRRVLSAKGHLVIVTPNNEDLRQSMVWCPTCRAGFHRWGHVQSFTCDKLARILDAAGFRAVIVKTPPLGFMNHWTVRQLWPVILHLRFLQPSDILIVVEKRGVS